MKTWIVLTSWMVISAARAAEPAQVTALQVPEDAQPLVSAIAQIGGIFGGLNQPAAATPAQAAASELVKSGEAAAEPSAPAAAEAKSKRTAKNSVILITSDAATGAAVGAAVSKDKRGAIAGAAIGAVAGLIYDRMTYKDPGKL